MKTRKNKNKMNKTRKGGKYAVDNKKNYERWWKSATYPKYDPQIDYPGTANYFKGKKPTQRIKNEGLKTFYFKGIHLIKMIKK